MDDAGVYEDNQEDQKGSQIVQEIESAIGFHGGEASNSRDEFNNLSTNEKDQLIKFLKSL